MLPGNVWCLKTQSAFIEGHAALVDGEGVHSTAC